MEDHQFLLAMPTGNPRTPTFVGGMFCMLAFGCSSFLFLRRVQAVYADNKWIRWFFSIFWLVYTGCEIPVPFITEPITIPGTRYYQNSGIRPIIALSTFAGVLFDSSVFLAISYKIASSHSLPDEQIGWTSLVSGRSLPRLSRAVLQGGQQYYLQVMACFGHRIPLMCLLLCV